MNVGSSFPSGLTLLSLHRLDSESFLNLEKLSGSKILKNKRVRCTVELSWGGTSVIDKIAPAFRGIMEEWHLISLPKKFSKKETRTRSRQVDESLKKNLRTIQTCWFGSWKHLLLGVLEHKNTDNSKVRNLMEYPRLKYQVDVSEDVIKAITRVGRLDVKCLSTLMIKRGCYMGEKIGIDDESLCYKVSDLLSKTFPKCGVVNRQPVILVPDLDIQVCELCCYHGRAYLY
ncbi:hypothetical protein QVD17_15719 [Tagetes erecta]|uniref:Uncharacterized protein n=1 Tax=Tagetes erecta TaxID=13708 RepID=A0AAD8NZV4_TARER|nr:hypothetical protein QVD17_15719 [Tagetes erecta]